MDDIGGIANKKIKEYFEKINHSKTSNKNDEFEIFYDEAGRVCCGSKSAYKRYVKFNAEEKVAKTFIDPKHNEKVPAFKTFKKQGVACYGNKNVCDRLNNLTGQVEDMEL